MVEDGAGGSEPNAGGQGGPRQERDGEGWVERRSSGAKRKWYQASLAEPLLGMVLGFLLVVLLAGVLGSPVSGLVRTITGGLPGMGGDSAPGESRTDGLTLYARYCAACHGEKGDKMPGADLTSRSFVSSRSELAIAKTVGDGKGSMPSFGRSRGGSLDDQQVRAVAAYVRTLGTALASANATPSPPQAATPIPQSGVPTPRISTLTSPTSTPVSGRSTPVAQPSPVARPSIPTPVAVIGGQPPIYDQYVGVVQHVDGWLSKHPNYVKNSGASFCFRCHGGTFCASCHSKRAW